ncbi:MAG: putative 3-phenylpropionic acid transporter, partial [Rhodospirillales bacterium]|nr:putative 3-phenylpropionic acid transporter [Rhodospirillales bacterium]
SALVPAMGVLGPPAVGLFADALGLRGSLLRVACLGSCLSLAALAAISAAGRALTFGVIFVAVLGYAVFRSPMVMLADVVAIERVRAAGTTYGRVRLWGSVGFLVAVLAAGRHVDPGAPAALLVVTAALFGAALLAAWALPRSPAAPRLPVLREARALVTAPDFALFLAVSLLGQIAHASYDLCFSLHLRDLGAGGGLIGLAWAIGVVFEIALMALAEPLVARFSGPPLVTLALLGAAARWALLANVRSLPMLLALQPLHALSFALWWIASLAYTRQRAPAHALATAQGLFSAALASGSVVGMLAWGAIYRRAGGGAAYASAAVIALGAGLLAAFWARAAPRAVPGA